jgi:hypothetical protein
MGLLNIFRSRAESPAPLPSGSFTVDRAGDILSSTVASSFSPQDLKHISTVVLKTFREAQEADMHFTEFAVHFGALTLKARELRGGAIIFLSPRGTARKSLSKPA